MAIGCSTESPNLCASVQPRLKTNHTVAETNVRGLWIEDVGSDLSPEALQEFISVWTRLLFFEPTAGIRDMLCWSWKKKGIFSTRSAYRAFFAGLADVLTAKAIWSLRAFAAQNRCWTSDRLAQHCLPHHQACPFCDQHSETLGHMLLGCVYTCAIWHRVFSVWSRVDGMPRPKHCFLVGGAGNQPICMRHLFHEAAPSARVRVHWH